MSKPSNKANITSHSNLQNDVSIDIQNNLFPLGERKISPVETSTFHTINFKENNSSDAILFSTQLTACAVVIIKNKENGAYDNVVTMAHFYPTNAQNHVQTGENISKIFKDFIKHGGKFNEETSIILAGGAVLDGEDMMMTSPLGCLIDCLNGNQSHLGYKFNHHTSSISNRFSPEMDGSMVFVDKNGTSILKTTRDIEKQTKSFLPLTALKASMPKDFLVQIANSQESYYPENIGSFFKKRDSLIEKMSEKQEKPDLEIQNKEELLSKAQNKSNKQER